MELDWSLERYKGGDFVAKNSGYYLNYPASLRRMVSDCNRSIRYARYWRKVEWRFRLKRAFKRSSFLLSFKHAGLFTGFIYDDEWLIENIANHYGYDMVDETLLPKKSIYKFALKKSKNL